MSYFKFNISKFTSIKDILFWFLINLAVKFSKFANSLRATINLIPINFGKFIYFGAFLPVVFGLVCDLLG